MRILLQANTWTYGLFTGLWRALRARGHEVFCDFMLPSHEAYFRRQNGAEGESSIVGACRYWIAENLRTPAPGEIAQQEKRLNLRLPEAWATDVYHVKFGVLPERSDVFQREFFECCFVTCIDYYERAFDTVRPDVVLFEGPNTFNDKVLFAVATARGIPAFNLAVPPFEGKFGLTYGSRYRDLLFEKMYLDGGMPSSAAVVMAREYISSLRTLAVKEAYFNRYVGKRAGLSWSFGSGVRFIAKLVSGAMQSARSVSAEEHRRRHLMWIADYDRRPLYAVERRRNERYLLRNACEPPTNEDFAVFYPHFQPEATTSVQAPYFINQNSLCEAIAISLPNDVQFYIKEHKSGIGDRGKAYFKDLLVYPNVRLISPFVSGVELAQKSRFVATVTGTIGFEAIALNKPVLIFGDAFYDICPWVHKVKNLEDLASIVPRLCELEAGNTGPDAESEIERFVACYFACLREGDFGAFTAELSEVLGSDPSNMDKVAESLEDLLECWKQALKESKGEYACSH